MADGSGTSGGAGEETVTRLGLTTSDRVVFCGLGAVAGGALGFGLPYLARWVQDWPWVPFKGVISLAGSSDASWLGPARPVLGVLLGLGIIAWLVHQSAVLHVSTEEVVVTQGGTVRHIPRSQVAGIHREGNTVVVETQHGRRLFEGEVEGGKDTVRAAFVSRGYPWEAE